MDRTRIKELLSSGEPGGRFRVSGWVRTRRDSKGGFSFVELNDGSCLGNLQVIVDWNLPGSSEGIGDIQTGCSLIVEGNLVASPGKGQRMELHADFLELVGRADPDEYPLQKKRHSLEFLRTIAHLRPRTNTFGAVARVRNAVSCAVHGFFQERGFILLHSPIISGSDCEGAGEMFRVTSLNMDDLPIKDGKVDFSRDFFAGPANLTVSGQLEAEIYALALGAVYTFGPTFRAENSNTSRHLAEFWMVEPEMAFCDLHGNMDLAEAFLKYIFVYVLDNCKEDMAFFNRFIDTSVVDTLERLVNQKFEPLTYTQAVSILAEANDSFEFPVNWGADLQSEHERYLCEKVFESPVILYDYPKDIKAFYMKVNEDGETVRAMDVLVPRIGEIIGGSQREDDYDTLHRRMVEVGLNPEDYWWYLELRKYGSAPHSGFGLGFERLVQFVTGLANIRDVIPFPRTPGNAAF
jgi:asparaginyl-tRNA synthetase